MHDPQSTPVRSVLIVGGGTAGWMTAASLAQRLGRLGVSITLVESSAVGTIGVGEATVPAIRRYFDSLGLSPFEVLKATNGTIKLAIEFDGWRGPGRSFMHPFGRFGLEAGPVAFHHLWNRLRARDPRDAGALDEYAMGAQLARAGRMAMPPEKPRVDFEHFDWAVHFDASRFAAFLRAFAESRGVRRIDARVAETLTDGEDIRGVRLDTGEVLEAELYLDCSGFHRLLIERALHSGFTDWRHWLPCDRAVALPCAPVGEALAPYTRSRAMDAGWTWRIPLQNRVGNGYVYSSDHVSDDAAVAALRAELEGEALAEPNFVRFRAGHVNRFWIGNCVAIGLASGFLEPLESTSISLIQMGIDKLLHLWPDAPGRERWTPLADEYNRLSIVEFERVRDFIVLHYAANGRYGDEDRSGLWRYCREMPLPETLVRKIAMYRARGLIQQFDAESFFDPSWLCMYGNLGIDAGSWDPLANLLPMDELAEVTRRVRADIVRMAGECAPHREFLRLAGALA